MNLLNSVLSTSPDNVLLTIIRIALGAVILAHGLQKVLGVFGGHGFKGTMGFFTQHVGLPSVVAFLAIVAESAGSVALIVGLTARIAAIGIVIVMLGAAWFHRDNGFFMNWNGNQKGEGYEYHILAIAMAVAVVVGGAGAYSIDQYLRF